MNVIVLASGSKGNSTYIEIGNEKILIDCGITYKQLNLRLAKHNKTLDGITKVFVTHEHSDHVSQLAMLAKKHDFEIYLSEGTLKHLSTKIKYYIDSTRFHVIEPENILEFNEFKVLPFMIYHDAFEPFGYRFFEKDKSLVYITDTGYFPSRKYHLISNAEAYIIESNHKVETLLESNRPWLLKRRILDDEGHLSNEDSANLLLKLSGDKTKTIILAHLSQECNTENDALEAYNRVFVDQGIDIYEYQIIVAKQNGPTKLITIE